MSVKRLLDQEVEKFLIDYGSEVLTLIRKHPDNEGTPDRVRGFEKLHQQGLKRIKGLIAEFGKER